MRNTTLYGLGHTTTTRRNSSAIEVDFINKVFEGTNLQNIEKSMRSLYVPDDGYAFVQRDQAGAEALIVAYLCRAGRFRQLFENNVKPHIFVALHVFSDVWESEMNKYSGDIKLNIKEFLDLEIPDLPKHPQWKELSNLIASSDNWPPERRYYYIGKQICHCVDNETEVLTPTGWVNVERFSPDQQLMVYNRNTKDLNFEVPFKWNVGHFIGEMVRIKTPYTNCLVTPRHKVLCHSNGKEEIRRADSLLGNRTVKIPIGGNYVGGDDLIHSDWLRLAVMLQADANVRKTGYVHINLKRLDKRNRLKELLKALNIKYKQRMYVSGTNVSHHFLFHLPLVLTCVNWIDWSTKTFNLKLLKLSKENLKTMLDELRFWDGSTSSNRIRYCSRNKANIDVFHTIAHILGQRASIVAAPNGNWVLTITNKGFATWSKLVEQVIPKPYNGKVYCPTTSTGFFLIRRRGKISVTGNSSNYDVQPAMFALNVLIKSKGRIRIKKKEAEKYLDFYHVKLFPEIREWHSDVRKQLEDSGILYDLFGHPNYFELGNQGNNIFKEAYAQVPQKTVATITAMAVTDMYNYIRDNKLDWHILADTHDSFMCQAPVKEAEKCNLKMKEFLNRKLVTPRGEKFSMKSEGAIGFNWAPYKKGSNELGLVATKD